MEWLRVTVGILCVWRITHLVNAEEGPWRIFGRVRAAVGKGFWGQVLDCFYCLSLYVAAPLAVVLTSGWKMRLLLWPALSAGAILLERVTVKEQVRLQDFYKEDAPRSEEEDNVLR